MFHFLPGLRIKNTFLSQYFKLKVNKLNQSWSFIFTVTTNDCRNVRNLNLKIILMSLKMYCYQKTEKGITAWTQTRVSLS